MIKDNISYSSDGI